MCVCVCVFRSSPAELVALAEKHRNVRVFSPSMGPLEREELYRGWKKAVQRTFGWIDKKDSASPSTSPSISPSPLAASTSPQQQQQQQPFSLKPPISIPSHSTALPTAATAAAATARRMRAPIFSQLALLGAGMLMGAGITAAMLGKRR